MQHRLGAGWGQGCESRNQSRGQTQLSRGAGQRRAQEKPHSPRGQLSPCAGQEQHSRHGGSRGTHAVPGCGSLSPVSPGCSSSHGWAV